MRNVKNLRGAAKLVSEAQKELYKDFPDGQVKDMYDKLAAVWWMIDDMISTSASVSR